MAKFDFFWNTRNYNRRFPKDYGLVRTVYITCFLYFIVWFVGIFFYNVKFIGWNNVDRKKHYIYTSNHQSYIDAPILSMVANAPVAYMAKDELYKHKNPLIKFLVISLGAFSVNREKPEIATFKTIKDIVNHTKWNLGIFPQGQISNENPKPEEIRGGFVAVAKMAKMDIVPVAICGFTGYAKIPFSKHLTFKVGEPISYQLSEDEIIEKWINFMDNNLE